MEKEHLLVLPTYCIVNAYWNLALNLDILYYGL